MMQMTTYPNCKINLGLHVVRKREDGYHDLETIFLPADSLNWKSPSEMKKEWAATLWR